MIGQIHDCVNGTRLIPDRYLRFITSLPEGEIYGPDRLLVPDLLLSSEEESGINVYYAPFGWCNTQAKLAIIGVTPGFTQMEIGLRVARRELLSGADTPAACRRAKYAASFAGTMRKNLIHMLDGISLPSLLGASSESLFGEASHLLHTTSAVCFPAFVHGRNYTGSRPRLVRSAFLMKFVREQLAPELASLEHACFLPLGKAVEDALHVLEGEGLIPAGRTLYGFPHPSGANGHRKRQFDGARDRLREAFRAALHADNN